MPMVVIDDILHLSVISDYTQLYAQVSTTFSRRPWQPREEYHDQRPGSEHRAR